MSVGICQNCIIGEGSGVSYVFGHGIDEIRVDKPNLFLLEDSIEEFEDLPAHQLIISINDDHHILRLAISNGCTSDIIHRSHLHIIPNQDVLERTESVLSNQIFYITSGGIL
jgi:hypothetical protein